MQIDLLESATTMQSNLNDYYPCLAITSIQLVSNEDQDQIICGLIDGRVL